MGLGAIVVTAAHRVFTGVLDGIERTGAARLALDREANARRLLTALIASVETAQGGQGFQGEPHHVAFSTWYRDGAGHAVRRRVSIEAAHEALVVHGLPSGPVQALHGVTGLELDYLLESGAAERFVRAWHSDASAPLAVRLRIAREARTDTLLALVGPRG